MSETRTTLRYSPDETLTICIERLEARVAKLSGYVENYGAELAVLVPELASYKAALIALTGEVVDATLPSEADFLAGEATMEARLSEDDLRENREACAITDELREMGRKRAARDA